MKNIKWIIAAMLMGTFFLLAAGDAQKTFKKFDKSGDKYTIADGDYFVYHFSEKPKLGTVILVIRIFDSAGSQITEYRVEGYSDMPSMRGAHSSGWKGFVINKKKNYLLPINFVMRGGWEISLRILKDNDVIIAGTIDLEI